MGFIKVKYIMIHSLYESMHALLYSLRTLVNFYMEVHLNFIFLTVRINGIEFQKYRLFSNLM